MSTRKPQPPPSPLGALTWRNKSSDIAATRDRFRTSSPVFPAAEVNALAQYAYQDALILADLVREEEPRVLFGALTQYSHEQLSVLVVSLAALVPVDLPVSKLTEWFTWAPEARAG